MRGAPEPLDTALGRRGDLLQGVAGQVGQLHPLEAGPQRLDRVQLGGVGGSGSTTSQDRCRRNQARMAWLR